MTCGEYDEEYGGIRYCDLSEGHSGDHHWRNREAVPVNIPQEAWQDVRADEDGMAPRLLATLTLNGLSMHLEAIAVEEAETGFQSAANAADDEDLAQIHAGAGADGPFQTATIYGREFVVFATPYCD